MTTKQKRYADGLKEKGLKKFVAIVPIDAVAELKKITKKLRENHLLGKDKDESPT